MTTSAPRLDRRLIEHLDRLASSRSTAAEIRRALVLRSRELGVPPPSYEHVRRLVALRRLELGASRESEALPVVLRVAVGLDHGNELLRIARGEPRRRS